MFVRRSTREKNLKLSIVHTQAVPSRAARRLRLVDRWWRTEMFSTASAVWSLNDVIILFSTCAFKLIFLVADKSDDKVRTDCARMRRASVGVHAYEDIFLKVPHSHNRNPYAHFKKMYLLVLALLFIINIIRRSHSRCFGGGFKL